MNTLIQFISAVRRRMHLCRIVRGFCMIFLSFSALALITSVIYVLRGYAVDYRVFVYFCAIGIVALVICGAVGRCSMDQAANLADRFFRLRECLISAFHFGNQGKTGRFYELQRRDAVERIRGLDSRRIPLRVPASCLRIGLVCCLGAGVLCLVPESEAVRRARQEASMIEERSKTIQEEMGRELEALKKDADPEEKELLEKSKLEKKIKKLKTTRNRKDALRQYAKIERELRKMNKKLDTRADEKFLRTAAAELKKNKKTRTLSQKLSDRKYRKAGKELEKMKPSPDAADAKKKKEKLSKLKKTADHLAKSANRYKGAKTGFCDAARELDKNVRSLSRQIAEMEKEAGECKECKKKGKPCENCRKAHCGMCKKTGEKLGKLSRMMSNLEARRKLLSRLEGLRKKMGSCQAYLLGKNGLKPGSGKDDRFDRKEKTPQFGAQTGVRLLKGSGPSAVQIQDAESGSGVSRVGVAERKRRFKYQVEGLVRREDVPEPLKAGVKKYFEDIHGSEYTLPEE